MLGFLQLFPYMYTLTPVGSGRDYYIGPDLLFLAGPDLLFQICAGIPLQGLIAQV